MSTTAGQVLKTYVTLTLLSTFASSLIWGINTLFLLDAGLSITAAFAANSFFTLGQVLFEVPTGVVADTVGRRASYLLGSATLCVSTLFYLYLWHIHGAFWLWALSSILLGLGFTFFSGATEAWLVDALHHTKYKGTLEQAFAKGQIATGVAMLTGTIGGGIIAQATNLGVPYILRALVLAASFAVTFVLMKDVGFTPRKSAAVTKEMRRIVRASLKHGLNNPPVRWLMLAAPFGAGVGFFGFYAMQPYLLQLYGRGQSYAIAGLGAALVAGAQIAGGFLVPRLQMIFTRRTTILATNTCLSGLTLLLVGLATNFWLVLVLLAVWGILFATTMPVRQAYINGLIPSSERATVLSSDNLLSSSGAALIQPGLGKAADIWSYGAAYGLSAGISILALPFIVLARRLHAKSDKIENIPMTAHDNPPTEPPSNPLTHTKEP